MRRRLQWCLFLLLLAAAFLWFYRASPRLSYRGRDTAWTLQSAPPLRSGPAHLETPDPLRALYMARHVLMHPRRREHLLHFAEANGFNAVVVDLIDVKGNASFALPPLKPWLWVPGTNLLGRAVVSDLHARGFYVIGRMCMFKNLAKAKWRPEWAVRRKDNGEIWTDQQGEPWLDPGTLQLWRDAARTARRAHDFGFDEINFDYIRYPTDGDLENTSYPMALGRSKQEIMNEGFKLLDEVRQAGIPTSIDVFGMVMIEPGDQGIGQDLDVLARYFDTVCPMVYPSHYGPGFLGLAPGEARCYQVVRHTLDRGLRRLAEMGPGAARLRPWLQDFDYPAVYSPEMVRAQITAAEEAGVGSWMMWNSRSLYSLQAYTGTTR